MGIRRLALAAAASVLLVGLTGCTTDAPTETGATTSAPTPTGEPLPDPNYVDTAPSGSPTVEMFADAFDPTSLSITAGDTVIFSSGDDVIHALKVATLEGVTVADGIPQFYQFKDAGTYTAVDEISGATVTITVAAAQ